MLIKSQKQLVDYDVEDIEDDMDDDDGKSTMTIGQA